MLHGDRSRIRNLALEAALAVAVTAVAYRWAALQIDWRPFAICLGVAGILALIGYALPDGPGLSEVAKDFDETERGAVADGRDNRDDRAERIADQEIRTRNACEPW